MPKRPEAKSHNIAFILSSDKLRYKHSYKLALEVPLIVPHVRWLPDVMQRRGSGLNLLI